MFNFIARLFSHLRPADDVLVFRRGLDMALSDYEPGDIVGEYLRKVQYVSTQLTTDLEADCAAHPERWELVNHFPMRGFKRSDVDAAIGLDFMYFHFAELHTQDETGNDRLTLMRKPRRGLVK